MYTTAIELDQNKLELNVLTEHFNECAWFGIKHQDEIADIASWSSRDANALRMHYLDMKIKPRNIVINAIGALLVRKNSAIYCSEETKRLITVLGKNSISEFEYDRVFTSLGAFLEQQKEFDILIVLHEDGKTDKPSKFDHGWWPSLHTIITYQM